MLLHIQQSWNKDFITVYEKLSSFYALEQSNVCVILLLVVTVMSRNIWWKSRNILKQCVRLVLHVSGHLCVIIPLVKKSNYTNKTMLNLLVCCFLQNLARNARNLVRFCFLFPFEVMIVASETKLATT